MSSSTSDKATTSWYFRLNQWSNKISAGFLVFVASVLLLLARPLPGKMRADLKW